MKTYNILNTVSNDCLDSAPETPIKKEYSVGALKACGLGVCVICKTSLITVVQPNTKIVAWAFLQYTQKYKNSPVLLQVLGCFYN